MHNSSTHSIFQISFCAGFSTYSKGAGNQRRATDVVQKSDYWGLHISLKRKSRAPFLLRSASSRERRVNRAASYSSCTMTPAEKYLFDLNGYVVVKNVLTPEELGLCNKVIDARSDQLQERKGKLRLTKSSALGGDGSTGRADLGGLLEWPIAESKTFRSILNHERLMPYYNALCGEGYRMDHMPLLITQQPGAEGFTFHGGATGASYNSNTSLLQGAVTQLPTQAVHSSLALTRAGLLPQSSTNLAQLGTGARGSGCP
ncbi:hypothetical protein CYMTET_34024 [Cymbomonas tetramitiformis]|uniref:Uncharacterized protein n=1 Tax=Cymbomonas tetramitiformis TaxID=36881 RepID=A0AAE0FCH9_9CHLO|nr:hypothetical protein CYMTET_34024 [Cymbomonas tetramitiformis]